MAEVTKEVKIVLIIDAIAALVLAFGGTVLVLGIMSLIALKRAEGEQVKIIIEFAILWSVVILCLNIWELIVLPLSPTYRETTWFDSLLLIVLIMLNSYFYNRDLK